MLLGIENIVLFNFIISFLMMGVIITTQIVNYPLFLCLTKGDFKKYHSTYVNKISFIAMPLMFSELVLSIILLSIIQNFSSIIILLSMLLIFLSTLFLQVPVHQKLDNGYNNQSINFLINTNWIRTFLWAIKSIASYNLVKGLL